MLKRWGIGLILVLSWQSLFAAHSPFRLIESREVPQLRPGEKATQTLILFVPADHFVYRDKTELNFFNLEGLRVRQIRYPKSKVREDPFFKKRLEVFEGESPIEVTFEVPPDARPGTRKLESVLELQGCSDKLCYAPEKHFVTWEFQILAAPLQEALPQALPPGGHPGSGKESLWNLIRENNFQEVARRGFFMASLIAAIGGFLTSLTPCVLPLIPVLLLIIGVEAKSSATGRLTKGPRWLGNLLLSGALVVGIATMYASLGLLAVGLGKNLGFVFQEKWFLWMVVGIFALLGLGMLGIFTIQFPKFVRDFAHKLGGRGYRGAFLSGLATGVLAAPCAGPVIGALLLFVATTQNFLYGFWLLFIYALGMGILFMVLGTGYGTFQLASQRGKLSLYVKKILGVLLIAASVFFLNALVPLDAVLKKIVVREEFSWLASESDALAQAKKTRQPILIDFYAEWCAPCKELELGLFRRAETVALLKQMVPLRIDATFPTEETEQVLDKYKVVGWPTVIFLSPEGQVYEDLSVIAFEPERILANMKEAIKRTIDR